jgi:hypothetical protein
VADEPTATRALCTSNGSSIARIGARQNSNATITGGIQIHSSKLIARIQDHF